MTTPSSYGYISINLNIYIKRLLDSAFYIDILGVKAWVKGAASSPCEPLRKPKTVTFCGHVEYARPISRNKKEPMRKLRKILAKHGYKATI